MGLDDLRLRETIDLEKRATAIREDLVPDLESRIDQAEAALEDEDADDPEQSPDQLRDLRDTLEGQAKACERVIDALDGDGTFTIQELMTAETAMLTDDVSEASLEIDAQRQEVTGTPQQGYHKVRTLHLAVTDAPDGMPSTEDSKFGREVYQVGHLPDHVTDYLYDCVVELNDVGEVAEAGNLSSYGVAPAES